MPNLTRTIFESDMSLVNQYRHDIDYTPYFPPLLKHDSTINQPGSSTVSQSYASVSSHGSTNGVTKRDTIEWRPENSQQLLHEHSQWSNDSLAQSRTQFEYSGSDLDTSNLNGIHQRGVAVVEIPTPRDDLAEISYTSQNAPEIEEDLFENLEDSDMEDSETEEGDGVKPITCLLSRQYYHIWKSTGMSPRSYLLPPSDGITWQVSSKRTPLYDHSPSAQSSYYRTWSKPCSKARRAVLDAVIKQHNTGANKRFLLTGPSKVCFAVLSHGQ